MQAHLLQAPITMWDIKINTAEIINKTKQKQNSVDVLQTKRPARDRRGHEGALPEM